MAAESSRSTEDDAQEPSGTDADFEVSKVEAHERRLGRYELVYEIGHGGMANVYLARARGPAGFQKWFAIKRVHDQLAKNRDFVNMFLDEARIAAAIQHPNVAQVFDLGEADGRYFLAMEYLHGEPLTALATRCSVSLGHVPIGLAAWLVARAAEGLHHAHEATDAKGAPMNLVHRDVSPHNLFVTYDGQVKVMDFGVAKAAGRITHTDTGVMKGKLAYSSPEQLRGDPLDRRADVFALGIVLCEIATGRRLFKASSDAETLHRIYSGYRLAPASVVPGFPPELERIIGRALAHEAEDRYATAAELARDLDRFLATSDHAHGSAELAATMRRLFPKNIATKEGILHREPGAGSTPPPAPPPVDEPSHSHARRTRDASGATPTPPAGRRRGPGLAVAVAVVLLLGIAGGALALLPLGGEASQVRVDTTPGGAVIRIDGRVVEGRSPVLVERVAEGTHRVSAELEGHEPFEASFEARGDRVELRYALVLRAAPAPEVMAVEPAAPDAAPQEAPAADPPAEAPHPRTSARGRRSAPAEARDAAPATLTLIARPWARVWLNGEDAGTTPIFRRTVASGTIRVRLQREGEGPYRELTIPAAPGEAVSRNISLD